MKLMKFTILALVLLIAYQLYNSPEQTIRGQKYEGSYTIDNVLEPYVNDWKKECEARGIKYAKAIDGVTIQVNNGLSGGTQGITYFNSDLIEIRYDVLDEWQTRFVVYHELGHYIFDYDHLESDEWVMAHGCGEEEDYKYSWEKMKDQYFDKSENNFIGHSACTHK